MPAKKIFRPNNRLLFVALFAVSGLYSLASLDGSSFFLHWDTGPQDMAAIDFTRGCWGYEAGKPLIMLLLGPLYWVLGANPLIEVVLLAVLAAAGTGAFYLVARKALPTRGWALVATLWFLSWATTAYYNRIHLGYPLALYLIGLALQVRGRHLLGGFLFGCSILAHPSMLLPTVAWIPIAWLLSKERRYADPILAATGLAVALLSLEALRFVYTGERFGWWRAQFSDIQAYSSLGGDFRWTHVLEAFWLMNGPLISILVWAGLLGFPLVVNLKENRTRTAIFATGFLLFLGYLLRTALGLGGFNPRLLTGVNPLLALAAITTFAGVAAKMHRQPNRLFVGSLAALLITALLANSYLSAHRYSQTAYPALEQAILQAQALGVSVRYFGQPYPALFFGVKHNVETLANWGDFEQAPLNAPDSVLIVEARTMAEIEEARAWLGAEAVERYEFSTVRNEALGNPLRALEEATFPKSDELRTIVAEAEAREPLMGIWIPSAPTPSPAAYYGDIVPFEQLAYYYHGDGDCQIRPRNHPYAFRYYRYLLPRIWERITTGQ